MSRLSCFVRGFEIPRTQKGRSYFLYEGKLVFLSIIDEVSAEVMWIDKQKSVRVKLTLGDGAYDTLVELITTLMAEARFSEEAHSDMNGLGRWNRVYVFVRNGSRWNGVHTLAADRYKDDSVIGALLRLGAGLFSLLDYGFEGRELDSMVETAIEFLIKSAERWLTQKP